MKRYKRAMEELPVPPQLVASTAAAMHKQLESQGQQRRPVFFVVRRVAAAAVLLVLIPVAVLWQNNRLIKTPLIADGVVVDVVVKNGTLHFEEQSSKNMFLPEAQFGIPSVEKEQWEPERYGAYLGKELRFQGIPKGMSLVEQQAEVLVLEGEKVVSDHYSLLYQSEDGQSQIEIDISKGKLPPGSLPNAEESSQMEGVPMHLSWSDKENAWQAQFLAEDIGYHIRGTGITQEAFIRLLYSMVE